MAEGAAAVSSVILKFKVGKHSATGPSRLQAGPARRGRRLAGREVPVEIRPAMQWGRSESESGRQSFGPRARRS